jgi:hypothetical protein
MPPKTAVPKAVSSIEDVEIGMSADLAIAGTYEEGHNLEGRIREFART